MKTKASDIEAVIRQAFKRSGLTKYRLAKDSGVDPTIVGRFMAGDRRISARTASMLAEALGLELRPRAEE